AGARRPGRLTSRAARTAARSTATATAVPASTGRSADVSCHRTWARCQTPACAQAIRSATMHPRVPAVCHHERMQNRKPPSLEDRLRTICSAFPEVTERPSHSAPTWFVRAGGRERSFVMLWAHGHHDNEFPHLWCAAPPGAQQELMAA